MLAAAPSQKGGAAWIEYKGGARAHGRAGPRQTAAPLHSRARAAGRAAAGSQLDVSGADAVVGAAAAGAAAAGGRGAAGAGAQA